MSRKELLSKLRRAYRDVDQVAAEMAKEEGCAVADEQTRKDINMVRARLRALEFRVDAFEGTT